MTTVTAQELTKLGYSRDKISRLKKQGTLKQISRGTYEVLEDLSTSSSLVTGKQALKMWEHQLLERYGMIPTKPETKKQETELERKFSKLAERFTVSKLAEYIHWALFDWEDTKHPMPAGFLFNRSTQYIFLGIKEKTMTSTDNSNAQPKLKSFETIEGEAELVNDDFTDEEFDDYVLGLMSEKKLREIIKRSAKNNR